MVIKNKKRLKIPSKDETGLWATKLLGKVAVGAKQARRRKGGTSAKGWRCGAGSEKFRITGVPGVIVDYWGDFTHEPEAVALPCPLITHKFMFFIIEFDCFD